MAHPSTTNLDILGCVSSDTMLLYETEGVDHTSFVLKKLNLVIISCSSSKDQDVLFHYLKKNLT